MNKQNPVVISFLVVVLLAVGVFAGFKLKGRLEQVGSVTVGNEYKATTTPYYAGWTDQKVYVGAGTFGSVIITKAGNSEFLILDATTTANKIDHFATTTKTLAAISAGTSAGTYTFDTPFNDGLVIEVISGTLGSSTITFRK
jgi:hypothetical protein